MISLGKIGPKPQFFDISCPKKDCKLYVLTDKDNVTGNGTYISRENKTRRYLCHECSKVFCDHTGTITKSSINLQPGTKAIHIQGPSSS